MTRVARRTQFLMPMQGRMDDEQEWRFCIVNTAVCRVLAAAEARPERFSGDRLEVLSWDVAFELSEALRDLNAIPERRDEAGAEGKLAEALAATSSCFQQSYGNAILRGRLRVVRLAASEPTNLPFYKWLYDQGKLNEGA